MARRGAETPGALQPQAVPATRLGRSRQANGPMEDAAKRMGSRRHLSRRAVPTRSPSASPAALITARAFCAQRARPQGRGRRRDCPGSLLLLVTWHCARRSARRAAVCVSVGRGPTCWSSCSESWSPRSATPCTRSPARDQPGLGMGGAGFRLSAVTQPAPDPQESSILAGALVATAVAVSAYGLYQIKVELPPLQAAFRRNPQRF